MQIDVHEIYGIDLGDRELRRARSWRWLALRVGGLLSTESHRSRLQRILRPPETPAGRQNPKERPTQ